MKQPVALILTDTHLHESNIELVIDIWKQAIEKCHELKIKKILFGGDFFTSRKAQPLIVDKAGRDIINGLATGGIELIALSGNHDKVDLESKDSYLDEYSLHDHCIIVRDNHCIEVDRGLYVHFIPYFKESTVYDKYLIACINDLVELGKDKKHILLTHIAVTGVKNNDGSVVDNGVGLDRFKTFDKVFIGHYHNQSQIGNNIYYIGSAYQSNFGEDDLKGFTILYSDGSHEFIQSKFPKYEKIVIDIEDEKQIKKLQKQYANSEDNIRFVFKGDETKLSSLDKEKFNALGIDVKFNKEVIRQDLSAVLETNTNFNRSNIKEAFDQFCELNEYSDKEVGINYLNKL